MTITLPLTVSCITVPNNLHVSYKPLQEEKGAIYQQN